MLKYLYYLLCGVVVFSCSTKKEILYLQNVEDYANTEIAYTNADIQPNDVLRITVGALIPESVIPYNKVSASTGVANVELMQLDGYLVSEDLTISFPELGTISVAAKTPKELAEYLKTTLDDGGHVKNPTVEVRLINAKVTILGEVNNPGTYTFTEQNITLLQALGYAGDLTINGTREDVLIMRDEDGVRHVSHIDLTSADWLNGPYSFVKPNDVIVVNQNSPKVKSAGYIGNLGMLLSVFSILLSTTLIISK